MAGQVYLVTNSVTGDTYVGLTGKGIPGRWAQHKYHASRHPRTRFHKAIAEFGPDMFRVTPYVSALHDKHLPALEKEVIAELAPTYNQTSGGQVTAGRKYDDATKERIRVSNTGKRRSVEVCEKIAAIKRQQFAENPELRAKNAERLRGLRVANEAKRVVAAAASARGRVWSAKSRAKLSNSCKGRVYSADIIAKMAASKRRAIVCVTTGVVYPCRVSAAAACGVSPRSVWRVCNKEAPSVKGLIFTYVA